ncbi:glycosyltransferase family 1 protein [bacterium]|nr:glycosyltransferase family 1 protein [bacterium]
MKVFLAPNTANIYDLTQLKELANGLRLRGHEAYVFECPIKQHHSDYRLTEFQRAGYSEKKVYQEINSEILIEVNRFRSRHLKKSTRHVSWFQDVRPSDYVKLAKYSSQMRPGDLIYLLGDKKHFGFSSAFERIECLLSGTSLQKINSKPIMTKDFKYDVNLLGYFSTLKERPPLPFIRSRANILLKEIMRRPKSLAEILFARNAHINLDHLFYDKLFVKHEELIKAKYEPLTGYLFEPELKEIKNNIDQAIYDYLYIEIPRKLDRSLLFARIQALHFRDKQVIIAGLNWPEGFPSAPFVRGHIDRPEEIYQSSKITIHNNTHGLGIHSRVLDCMAVGGFVMMHPSPHSRLPGGMDSTFEPDVNYGLYSADNFVEKVEEWLADEDRRNKAITENKKILLSKHLWEHRAEQILRDLR